VANEAPKKKIKKDAAKKKIREFLIANVGKKVTTQQISKVSGIIAHARRVRELRDDEGMQISTHKDRDDLKPGEYVLESIESKPVVGGVSSKLRNQVLERDGFTCVLCGATAGDPSAYNPNRKLKLHVDHNKPGSQEGKPTLENLRTLCSDCNQGRQNIQAPSETARNILARIRRLPRAEQREVHNILKKSFPDEQPLLIPIEKIPEKPS
jgi:5-methylcytosine-specific restriction endonuclease McrA